MGEYRYPQIGQRRCYDWQGHEIPCIGSGQDAEFCHGLPWPQPRFVPRGALIEDRLTGLHWPADAAPAEFPLNWNEALAFVSSLNQDHYLGYRDWRLPNRRELHSLISYQTTRPALPAGHPFTHLFQGWYWSSTTAAISPAHAWYVDMAGGRTFFGGKDQSFMVWPVRGQGRVPQTGQLLCYDGTGTAIRCGGTGQDGEYRAGIAPPAPRFELREAGVLDRLTGLLWQRSADGAGLSWEAALATAAASGEGWRLPNLLELESLVDGAHHSPALPAGHPFELRDEVFWSATTSLYEPDWAWALYLAIGALGVGQKSQARFGAWAVWGPL